MGNLVTQYIRRISKLITGYPNVGPDGTNHVDNPNEWNTNTLYPGEIAINKTTGRLFSADEDVFELNTDNKIVSGMQVVAPPAAVSEGIAIPLDLQVTNGYVKISGRTYKHISVTDSNAGDVTVLPSTSARYDLIYAISDYPNKYNESDDYYKAAVVAVSGPTSFDSFFSNEYLPDGLTKDECVLLAIVYIPIGYTIVSSPHMLRPWSWGVAPDTTRFLNLINAQPENPQQLNPSFFIEYLQNNIFKLNNAITNREKLTLLKNQLIVSTEPGKEGYLYRVRETHFCSSLNSSVISGNVVIVGGSGGGGATSKETYIIYGVDAQDVYEITHTLNTENVIVNVYDNNTMAEVGVDIELNGTNSFYVVFSEPTSEGEDYLVVVIG
jgi:hypothetical protein